MFQTKVKRYAHQTNCLGRRTAEGTMKDFAGMAGNMLFDDVRVHYYSGGIKHQRVGTGPAVQMSRKNGCQKAASTSARLQRAIDRRRVPNYLPRTPSDRYAIAIREREKDGKPKRIYIETPYTASDAANPYMMIGRWGPIINGEKRPKKRNGRATTQYADMAGILDHWCGEKAGRKKQLATEMAVYLKTGKVSPSKLFRSPKRPNELNAARFMSAILMAAEPHRLRQNPDGGKLARTCLRAIADKEELTFTEVFAGKGDWFPQALKGGNRKHAQMMTTDGFNPNLADYMSESSEEEFIS